MEEIKRRNSAIYDALNGFSPSQPKIILAEFCCLQLRYICELIAVGCLVAHGELRGNSRQLLRKWHAGEIIRHLEKVHPDFYPLPTKQILGGDGKVNRLEPINEPYLSKIDLIQEYGWLGNQLHIGNFKKFVSRSNRDVEFSKIDQLATKIRNLLNHHCIQLIDSDFQIWTIMQANSDGRVHVYLMEKAQNPT